MSKKIDLKLSFDGMGLNDANNEYRERVATLSKLYLTNEIGEEIAHRVNLYGELEDALKTLTDVDAEGCHWCNDESWFGSGHMTNCPVSIGQRALVKAEGKAS